ncbi:MAG: 50S ribosomal protein L10 [Candidatus Woesearchaeota archaeon]
MAKKIQEYKKKIVQDMVNLAKQHSIIGVVNMENLPAPQLQAMRADLRGKINLFMTKKRFIKIALEKIKAEKIHVEELEKYLEGMPALVFTNESPFKLSRILQKSKTSAPAKAGQIAPNDIIVRKGPTPFAPGPIISELSEAGLKVGVEGGKVAVKEDTVVAKKGDKIKPKVAEILTRLDIKPMQVGLGLVAAYEDGIIYQRDILEIDEKQYSDNINLAATEAFNLAFDITYITKDNVELLIAKAFNDAKALGISQKIFDEGIIEELLGQAEREMLGLKGDANIETKAPEVKKEAKPKEEPKPELKEEPKEEKKIKASIQEEVEKKEEKILEEEERIIEEEKQLEEEKPKEVPIGKLSSESEKGLETPEAFQKEVQEAVKEEEEKKLEKERIDEEKELEKIEKQKKKVKETKERPAEDDVDKKVKIMVEQTKKFAAGTEETAEDILKEVNEEEKEEPKESKAEVPSTHNLKKQKEEKETKQDKGQKEVEELAKELLRKGTLRKK